MEGPATNPRCPRTPDELSAMVNDKPRLWEYLLYGGTLYIERDALESRYRDHLLAYAEVEGEPFGFERAIAEARAAFDDARAMAYTLEGMFDEHRLERAFGAPGEPGDAAIIQQLAKRTIDGYAGFIDWTRRLRAMRVPTELRQAFRLAADLMNLPIEQCRAYVDRTVEQLDQAPALLAQAEQHENSEPANITIKLELTIDDEAVEMYTNELDRCLRQLES